MKHKHTELGSIESFKEFSTKIEKNKKKSNYKANNKERAVPCLDNDVEKKTSQRNHKTKLLPTRKKVRWQN